MNLGLTHHDICQTIWSSIIGQSQNHTLWHRGLNYFIKEFTRGMLDKMGIRKYGDHMQLFYLGLKASNPSICGGVKSNDQLWRGKKFLHKLGHSTYVVSKLLNFLFIIAGQRSKNFRYVDSPQPSWSQKDKLIIPSQNHHIE